MKKLGFLSICAILFAATTASAAVLPQGFRLEPFATGLTEPWDLDDTPAGLILIAERTTGNVRYVQWGELQPGPICTVAVDATGEGGLVGVAVHPDYNRNGWIYLYFTDQASGNNKVTRYTIFSNYTCGNPVDILPDLGAGGSGLRNGGGIDFGPDGKLYVATGDMEVDANGQSLGTVQAKVLRLNDDGSIPADNPIPGSEIFTVGLRDPRGLSVNPDGTVYVSDAGDDVTSVHHELNVAQADGNLGWSVESGAGGSFDPPLQGWLSAVDPRGVVDYDGTLFPDADADGEDNDHDSYGPDHWPGVMRTDDDGRGECIGSENNGGLCSSVLECLPTRTGESSPICEKRDDPGEHCPGGTPFGDDDCDNVGKAGIDEPDESYTLDVFAARSNSISRAALTGGANDELSAWSTFLDATALGDCPSDFTGMMSGRDGHLYVLARSTGGLYRIVHDEAAGPREVSATESYVPLRLGKSEGVVGPRVEIFWEDLRKDSMQVGRDGNQPTAPVREYTVWRGEFGVWDSHTPFVNDTAGVGVSSVIRSQTAAAGPDDEAYYYLVSGRGNNFEGSLGSGEGGERAGFAVTDICDTIGMYDPPILANWFKCAPEVTLIDELGIETSLSEFRGRPVWIDFPAEWCGPCITEANEMEAIYQDYKDRGVVVLSILVDEESQTSSWDGRPTPAECRLWGNRPGSFPDHTFSCWADSKTCTGNPCQGGTISQEGWPKFNQWNAFPTNAIIDQDGRLVWSDAGWSVEGFVRGRLNTLVGATDTCLH